jgi:hypothetical protein
MAYKRKNRAFMDRLAAKRDQQQGKEVAVEKLYKSTWHLLIAAVGFYELSNHKTKLSKALACGLIAFHLDACIADALGTLTTPQKLLKKVFNK